MNFLCIQLNFLNPYVTWSIRQNPKWGNYNNKKEDLVKIYKYLKNKFPKHKIFIISTKAGCNWAKKLLSKKTQHIYYSSNFTNNFIGCFEIICNSDYYFEFKGGGMKFMTYLTRLPYKIIAYIAPLDTSWSNKKYLSWQYQKQERVYNYKKINLNFL